MDRGSETDGWRDGEEVEGFLAFCKANPLSSYSEPRCQEALCGSFEHWGAWAEKSNKNAKLVQRSFCNYKLPPLVELRCDRE